MIPRRSRARGPVHVAHVTFGLDVGGLEKLLVEFARHADRDRFRPRFVSLGARGVLAEEIEECGWPVIALDEPPGLRPGLPWRLARRFVGWGLDVVHTHDNRPIVYGGAAARLAGVRRVIHTRHGLGFGCGSREVRLVRQAARLVNRFVCVSDDAAAQGLRDGVAASKLRTVRNGIDLSRFTYSGPRPDGPVVVVARLSPEKDVATLVRALGLAARAGAPFPLEIAGDGPCLPALRRLVAEWELGAHVRFHGAVRDVPALLERAGLFVLPSLSEGIALTLLEASARGLPIVATRVGGTPEVVVEGETGVLVPPGDAEELARAIVHLRRYPEAGRRMGLAGRKRVEEWFDVRRMVAEYERLYVEPSGRERHPLTSAARPSRGPS